ncbi:hypothetical protein QR680_004113 [Steinernema hermaphroditum]|uniref:Uncharacterized protein n=1 Tax=Steinernema hermaphroditum TaxID=289476 RepID=A0AA39HNQ7_9BILA|nr:hypothetical protein QR680_004113 [Steinernema hermaphroditum]
MYNSGHIHVKLGATIVAYINIFIGLLESLLFFKDKISIVTFCFVLVQMFSGISLLLSIKRRNVPVLKFYAGFQGFFVVLCFLLLLLALYSHAICMGSFMSFNGFVETPENSKEIRSKARTLLWIYTAMLICHTAIATVSLHTVNYLLDYFIRRQDSDLASIDL